MGEYFEVIKSKTENALSAFLKFQKVAFYSRAVTTITNETPVQRLAQKYSVFPSNLLPIIMSNSAYLTNKVGRRF